MHELLIDFSPLKPLSSVYILFLKIIFFTLFDNVWDLLTLGWISTLRCKDDSGTGSLLDPRWEKRTMNHPGVDFIKVGHKAQIIEIAQS